MPDPFETLATLGEIGIALTGFSGVVAVLGQRGRGEWSTPDWLRFSMLLGYSLGSVFFAFLPALLLALGASTAATWALASLILAAFVVGSYVLVIRRVFALGEIADEQFPRTVGLTVGVLMVPIVCLLVLNAAGVFFDREFGPFLLGVIALVAAASFQFYRLLRVH